MQPVEKDQTTQAEQTAKKYPVRFRDIFYLIFGALIISFSLVGFTVPNKIAAGGLNGIATILVYSMNIPVSVTIFAGNFILIIMQMKLIGKRSAWKTLLSVSLISVFTWVFTTLLNLSPLTNDTFLACLYGGILVGIGVGMTFRGGGTTGGTDILSQIIHRKFHFPIGETILISNCFVAIAAGIAFGPELALYGLITVFFTGKVIDAVLEGMSVFRNVLIISQYSDEISWSIIEDLHRGVTSLSGAGVYSAKQTNILMTVVRTKELSMLRRIIYTYDPSAFVIIGDARQVIGRGFVKLDEEIRIAEDK